MVKYLKASCLISYSVSQLLGKMQKYQSFVFSLQMRLRRFSLMALSISAFASLKVKLVSSSSTNNPPGYFSTSCMRLLQSLTASYLLTLLILQVILSTSYSGVNLYFSLYWSMFSMATLKRVRSLAMVKVSFRSSTTFLTELFLRMFFQSQGFPQLRLNSSSIQDLRMAMVLLSNSNTCFQLMILLQAAQKQLQLTSSGCHIEESYRCSITPGGIPWSPLPQIIGNLCVRPGPCQRTRSFARSPPAKTSRPRSRRSPRTPPPRRSPARSCRRLRTTAAGWTRWDCLR